MERNLDRRPHVKANKKQPIYSAAVAEHRAENKHKICLVMIVKNEASIIGRCLTAALPHIDTWSITDTGSTDDTPKIIERFFAEHKIPGKLSLAPFKHFAQARNAALEAAKTVDGWEYALLVDADMVLTGTIDKKKLTAPAYDLVQSKSDDLDYDNTRLVRRDAVARYIGVTHEFLSVSGNVRLTSLAIDDRDDGGSKSDKADRDIRLLTAGLAEEPDNVRYMFYLAQTYRETGRYHQAIQWYTRRIQGGGWDEEIWFSKYGIALSFLAIDDELNFIKACFDAYNCRPTRGEPLKLLAKFFRERSQNDSAMLIAEALMKIKTPKDKLFIERNVYEHGAEQEFAIAGFYSHIPSRREKAYESCADLTVRFNSFIRNEARRNITFYLKSVHEMFGAEVKPIKWKPNDGYAPMNPSVCIDDAGRRLVLVRTVNYTVTPQGQYPTTDGSNIIRTRNHIVEMDEGWTPIRSTPIEDATEMPRTAFPVEGFEDCRLWTSKGKFYASATVRDRGDGRCEQAILSFDKQWRVVDIDVVRDFEYGQNQKNWMPIVGHHGSFLYFCDPTVAIKRTPTGTVERARHQTEVSLVDQRGGSQLVEHGDGWLCLTHEVVWRPERIYMHRFVKLDREMRIVAVTDPFYFARVGIEFCAGLARDGSELVASFGVNDESAHIALFEPARINLMLKPVTLQE